MTDLPANDAIGLMVAQVCAIGARQSNQDAIGSEQQDDLACFIVSDGTGGHAGGEIASALVVDSIKQRFLQESCFGARALHSYVDFAIERVAENKRNIPQQQDMSATVAAILFDQSNRSVIWAHMGDTRIYMFRNGKIHKISRDHSLAQRLVDAGYLDAGQLRTHPQRSVLFAAIGAEGDTPPDITEEAIRLEKGDAFLLCTDGFWEWITDAEMEQCLLDSSTSEEWLSNLTDIADKNVSETNKLRDNYSAYAIFVRDSI